jgi:hypothetical protein
MSSKFDRFSMPLVAIKQIFSPGSSSLVRDAQTHGALPLGAVQRLQDEQDNSLFGVSTETSTDEPTNLSKSMGEQVSLSPMSQLKEMLRQRVADLFSRSEALVRRIIMSGPEQVEALSNELKRLGLELKRLISQYKALKGMEDIQGFQAGSQSSSDSLSSVTRLASASEVSSSSITEPSQSASLFVLEQSGKMEFSMGVANVSREVDQNTQFGASAMDKLKQEAISAYEQFSSQDGFSDKNSQQAREQGGNEEDGIEAGFREILKKLKQARDLLEAKARFEDDRESLEVLEDVKRIENAVVTELAQFDSSSMPS